MIKVYLQGVNVVIDSWLGQKRYVPTRASRFEPYPNDGYIIITDSETTETYKFMYSDLQDKDGNTFATEEEAEAYLSEFVGSFKMGGGGDFVTKEQLVVVGTELDYNDLVANQDPADHLGKYFITQQGANGVVILGRRFYGNDPGLYLSTGTSWELRRDIDGSDIIINTANLSYSDSLQLRDVLEDLDVEIGNIKDSVILSSTQWSTSINSFSLSNGFFVNLFSAFIEADKVPSGVTSYDEYSIVGNGIVVPYIGRPYENQKITHFIRINFNIITGSRQNLRLELRRVVDDSVIGSPVKVDRNPDEPGVQELFMTYTSSATDSFVTGGFYIALVNESGATVVLDGDIGLLIENFFQKPNKF